MSEVPQSSMSVDEFLAWAEGQPGRYELVNGRVFAMTPERLRHAETKFAVQAALARAIASAGLSCFMVPDGLTVRIDRTNAFEPDALVYCGERRSGDTVDVPDPVIVVEVLSPSTRSHDTVGKLAGYFTLPSLRHYLIVDSERRMIVHHQRGAADTIATRIVGFGFVRLKPPGIEIAVDDLFGRGPD